MVRWPHQLGRGKPGNSMSLLCFDAFLAFISCLHAWFQC
jgi:hypothetical protein